MSALVSLAAADRRVQKRMAAFLRPRSRYCILQEYEKRDRTVAGCCRWASGALDGQPGMAWRSGAACQFRWSFSARYRVRLGSHLVSCSRDDSLGRRRADAVGGCDSARVSPIGARACCCRCSQTTDRICRERLSPTLHLTCNEFVQHLSSCSRGYRRTKRRIVHGR